MVARFEFNAKHAAKAAKAARNVAVDAVIAVENRCSCHIYNV
jgi:hypothetical protein